MVKKIKARGLTHKEAATFQFQSMAIHLVPRHKVNDTAAPTPDLSEDETPLTPELRTFFREKVIGTMGLKALPVEENKNANSKVPDEVKSLLNRPNDLVTISQDMANQLYAEQTGINTKGLLVVAIGTVSGGSQARPAVLVMKLKQSEGANVEKETVNGKRVYTASHLHNLMLTSDTKVFKAAVLSAEGSALVGIVSDEQVEQGAKVFREDFLGMKPARSAALVTKQYVEQMEHWIEGNDVLDPETRMRYRMALRVDVGSHDSTLQPQAFISSHIDEDHRDSLLRHLRVNDVPTSGFPKDTTTLAPKQFKTQTELTSKGLRLTGAPVLFELVETGESEDGEPITIIRDVIVR